MIRSFVSGFAFLKLILCQAVQGVHGMLPCRCVPFRERISRKAPCTVLGLDKSSAAVYLIT